jgi:hypothetical protein
MLVGGIAVALLLCYREGRKKRGCCEFDIGRIEHEAEENDALPGNGSAYWSASSRGGYLDKY